MKVGEAQKLYRAQRAAIIDRRRKLVKKKEELDKKIKTTFDSEKREVYTNEAATLELSIGALNEKFDENQEVLDRLTQQYASVFNAEASRQQKDAMEDAAVEMGKIMEVARRIGKGARVPANDEKKVMDYSMELYMAAKNLAMLNKMNKKKKEEYDSLWGDEEEKKEYDPEGKAENAETSVEAPEDLGTLGTLPIV
ncbi:hypothetical protein C809_02059 [Lachnospiraceae bacterium MD335]|nr:hypothetical protein C809_02059 [Lachnospiraceae bacterium MD335]